MSGQKWIARRLWGAGWEGQAGGGLVGTAGRNSGSTSVLLGWGGRRGDLTELMDVAQQVSNRQNSAGRIGADGRMKMAAVLGKRPSLCGKIQQQPSRLGRRGLGCLDWRWTDGGRWTGGGQEIVARPVSLPRSAVVCLVGRFRRGRVVARRAGGLAGKGSEGGSVVRCGDRRQECRVESCFLQHCGRPGAGAGGVAGTIFGEREFRCGESVTAVCGRPLSGQVLLWVEEATFF